MPTPSGVPQAAVRYSDTAAASERNRELGAQRAANDPAKLAKSIRTVKAGQALGLVSLADLVVPEVDARIVDACAEAGALPDHVVDCVARIIRAASSPALVEAVAA